MVLMPAFKNHVRDPSQLMSSAHVLLNSDSHPRVPAARTHLFAQSTIARIESTLGSSLPNPEPLNVIVDHLLLPQQLLYPLNVRVYLWIPAHSIRNPCKTHVQSRFRRRKYFHRRVFTCVDREIGYVIRKRQSGFLGATRVLLTTQGFHIRAVYITEKFIDSV